MSHKTDFSKIDLSKYYYDEQAANSAVRYIEDNIKHNKGKWAGKPFLLEEWQKNEIVKPIFGWKHKGTGLRKYTSAYVEIPKKSGKSFLAASFAAIFLDIEREGGSEIVGVAWGRKQAGLVFDATKLVINKSPRLSKKCKVYRHSITAPDHLGGLKTYQILSKEAGGEDGINPQLAIIDELHVHKSDEVIEMVEKSMGAREQPLSFIITTAGSDLYGIGFKRHEEAIDVVKGKLKDESLLVCIYGAEAGDDPFSEETWKKANPNYNISIGKRAYEKEAAKARASQASLNAFKRYYLNIWTATQDGWIDDEVWAACDWEINESLLLNEPCYGGLDLSTASDFSAFTLIWKIKGKYYSKTWFWCPENVRENSAAKYNRSVLDWVEEDYITLTPGNSVDHDFIFEKIKELAEKYNVQRVAFDRFRAEYLIPKLGNEGINCVPCGQGYVSLLNASVELERSIKECEFNHFGNPVLRWMAGNCIIIEDSSRNWKVTKDPKHKDKKIDGIVSNIMAMKMTIDENDESYLTGGELYII